VNNYCTAIAELAFAPFKNGVTIPKSDVTDYEIIEADAHRLILYINTKSRIVPQRRITIYVREE